jgi:aspartate aminotransferase
MDWFLNVERAAPDKIYGVQEEYLRDNRSNKINLSIGVYRDENGLPFIPLSVIEAERLVLSRHPNKEYAPIEGFADFRQSVAKFIYGEQSDIIKQDRHSTVQGLGGTGSLRVGAMFLSRFLGGNPVVYLPEQTWSAHKQIFSDSGLIVKYYRYWSKELLGLDFDSLLEDISEMPSGSIIVLHAIAHNPTGADPTPEQWQQISNLIKDKNLFVFFDLAYQGFASGDIDEDAYVVRMFAEDEHQFMIAMTFAKNMALYGERIGALSIVCGSQQEADNVLTQLKKIIRPIYSHPPNHGAKVVSEVLNNSSLKLKWFNDMKIMSERIKRMRLQLKQELIHLNSGRLYWDFIGKQVGMYCYSGLNETEVNNLRKEFRIYVADDGRINMAAINDMNIQQIAIAIHNVKLKSLMS